MASNHTENYQLNLWEPTDRFLRTEFNENSEKLDAALKAEADARAEGLAALRTSVSGKAATAALNALTQTVNGKADAADVAALAQTVNGKADASTVTALTQTVNGKADASTVTALTQTVDGKATTAALNALTQTVNGKAAASHGTHVSYSTTAPVMDGTASAGSAATVARSDHKHPTDTSRAAANHTHTAAEVGARPSTWTPTAADVGALASGGTAAAATKLATARTIRTNLASTSTASFNGTANVTPGVTGTLPIANGGTGATTAAAARTALGAAAANHTHTEAVVAGTYTGDGEVTRVINLGFRPKAVLIFTPKPLLYKENYQSYYLYGGLAVDGSNCVLNDNIGPGIAVVDQGFQVSNKTGTSSNGNVSYYNYTNSKNSVYHYVAFR